MNQKAFVIIFLIVTGIVVAVLGYSQWNSSSNTPNPSASPRSDLFGQGNNATGQNTPSQGQQQAQPEEQQKQIKQYSKFPGVLPQDQLKNKKAVIETDKGTISFEIYPEATKAASNFIFLAQDKFYDGTTFHRVVKTPQPFVIQGGDPLGTGSGGPGYKFEDEPVTRKYDRGIVAMANSGPNTNGSQFFIMLADTPLPPSYTIFGKVLTGMDVVDKITVGDVMKSVKIEPLK